MKHYNQKFKFNKFPGAFTLVELLVVVSVIGLLMGFGMSKYSTAEKQTRDSKRQSDMNQYRIALENYAVSNNSLYPLNLACGNVTLAGQLCAYVTGGSTFQSLYLSGECLNDPRYDAATNHYHYCSDAAGSQYVLWGPLEGGGVFEICSNGRSGKYTGAPTNSTCDL